MASGELKLRLTNTLTRTKEDFVPLDPANVGMYVCGPTVYDFAHIGNARPAIVFDVLFRLLRHVYGPEHVTYVRNITDVDDKINARAARDWPDLPLNEAIRKVTETTANQYQKDVTALGCLEPTVQPRATDNIDGMQKLIGQLIANHHAYEAAGVGEVLFDVRSMPDYGALSGRDLSENLAGARIEVDAHKHNAADFVLWKKSSASEPGWDSPWGRGRPGWHIECSAMSERYLGQMFDIHAGGLDLIFPHHENEIAQSRCAHSGAPLARHWVHNGFLDMGAEKMSKSLGNVVTVGDLNDRFVGGAVRLALLSAHYRQPLAWTDDLIERARITFEKWCGLVTSTLEKDSNLDPANLTLPSPNPKILEALQDDLNTPLAITTLHQSATTLQRAFQSGFAEDFEKYGFQFLADAHLLGLSPCFKESSAHRFVLDLLQKDEIEKAISSRTDAKARRDFAKADRLRDELKAKGILLEDGPEGTTWRRA